MLNRVFGSAVLVLPVLTGCAHVDPFTQSDEAMMAQVAEEVVRFSGDLAEFFEQATGKQVVIVNLENDHYTDDQLPEYMLHDAFYKEWTGSDVKITILDRDPDILSLMERERDGLDLPASWSPATKLNEDSLTIEQRRREIGRLIAGLVEELSEQDVLVMYEAPCCNGTDGREGSLQQ